MHLLTALLTALAVSTTALAQTTTDTTRPLRIVTSFLPIQSHTLAIAGQNAEVVQLLGKDAGPHDFQLSPSDVKKLAEADLFIINGAGIEDWLDDLVKKSGNKDLVIVDTSKGVDLVESPEEVAIAEFPEKDPTPRQLASLVDKIRELKVGVLFAETGYAPGLLEKIAKETGAKVSSLDTLEVGQGGAKAYLERMRKNLSSLQRAFGRDE